MTPQQLEQPNFVFINTDQQRWDTLGCYGNEHIDTPNIDRLAEEGYRFERCYTTHPKCMPARASFFTGQYTSHHGGWQNGVPLNKHADMIQTHLKEAGYHTALIGKMHLDNVWLREEPHPPYGFDLIQECEGDPYCKDDYFRWLEEKGLYEDYMEQFKEGGHKKGYTRDIPEDLHMNSWIVSHVEDYFEDRSSDHKPFFLSVGFFDPHHPFDPCEPYASMYDPDDMPMPTWSEREKERMTPIARNKREGDEDLCTDPDEIKNTIAAYYGTISHVDQCVGEIMDALKEAGLEDNTVIVFTSDHGELLGDHGMLHKGTFFYECSVRVPLIYRFPQNLNIQGTEEKAVSHIDFVPTVSELAGIDGPKLAQGQALFGGEESINPLPARGNAMVESRDKSPQDEGPFDNVAKCLITDRWKYVYYHGEDFGELYDLQEDPDELNNLWADSEYREKREEMRTALFHHIIDSEPTPMRTDIF